uniref:Uncharacterized protein n=1 Tax=Oryza barthii TaxID=65489 RepID=A0A0D3HLE3_9ORYZ
MSGGGATVGSGRRWGRAEAGSTRSVRAWQQRAGFDAVIVFEEKKGQKSRSSTEQSVAITTMVAGTGGRVARRPARGDQQRTLARRVEGRGAAVHAASTERAANRSAAR